MSPLDNQLDRLFRAAAKEKSAAISAAPYGLETRVLAAWHDARTAHAGFWDMRLLMRGMIVAGLILVVSLLPALSITASPTTNPFAEFLQMADSNVPADDAP